METITNIIIVANDEYYYYDDEDFFDSNMHHEEFTSSASTNFTVYPGFADVKSGQIHFALSGSGNRTIVSKEGHQYHGLPVIAMSFIKYTNGQLSDGDKNYIANYALVVDAKSFRDVAVGE